MIFQQGVVALLANASQPIKLPCSVIHPVVHHSNSFYLSQYDLVTPTCHVMDDVVLLTGVVSTLRSRLNLI